MSFPHPTPNLLPDSETFLAHQERTLLVNRMGTVFAPNRLPEFLRQWRGWLRKDPANPKKPMYQNSAGKWISTGWNKPENQARYGEALPPDGRAGVHARDGLIVIDFDSVVDSATGQLSEPVVEESLARLNTYASYSSSGTGLHIFARTPNVELQRKYSLRVRSSGDTKLGEWLGDSFVALTGVAVPAYADRPVVELSAAQERYIFGNLLNIRRESGQDESDAIIAGDDLLGISPKAHYRSYFLRLIRWKRSYGMKDTSHSVWNQYMLRAYFQGDDNPTPCSGLSLSIRYERHFEATAPPEYRRDHQRKSNQWHLHEVLKALEYVQEKGRLTFTDGGPDYLATPYEKQAAHFLNHLLADKALSATAVRLAGMVVAHANGRSEVVITNPQMAQLLGCSERTVKRLKPELRSHSCITYDHSKLSTTYKLKLDNPCNP